MSVQETHTRSVRPGEVNWMTAGKGITHSERFEKARLQGGLLDGIQAWVALPEESEEMEPGFWHFDEEVLPVFDSDGVSGRLIAGQLSGLQSPVRVESPQFYVHWQLQQGARVSLPAEYSERAVYVVNGRVEVAGQHLEVGSMAVLTPGKSVTITAFSDAVVMALGGESVGPRYIDWNFVSSSKERLEQARADWQAGRMKLPDLDDKEFIALPPKQGRVAEPRS